MLAQADTSWSLALADLNADGAPDLAVANQGQNRSYLGNGIGGFVDVTAGLIPPDADDSRAVAATDLDLDGDVDLVFGNRGQNRLYLNHGTGALSDATSTRCQSLVTTPGRWRSRTSTPMATPI